MNTEQKTIELNGDTWRVLGLGTRHEGKIYAHLASTTRFIQQRNGQRAIQMADWIDEKLVA
jgi:hypothetical protein